MLVAVQKEQAKTLLDRYFNLLSATGYIKHPMVVRYLIWLFLVDFVEKVFALLTNEDYKKINDALFCVTNAGCCLLPYIYTKSNYTWGEPIYMGTFKVRLTETGGWRIQEDNNHPRLYY